MRRGSSTTALQLALCALLALAGPGYADSLSHLLPPRPSIDDYQNQAQFVADVLAWERERDELARKLQTGELQIKRKPGSSHDWHHVTGPEDLDTAVENARGYEQPRYREQYRFNRTTHLSFPLQHLPAEDMAHEVVEGERYQANPVLKEDAERLPTQVIEQLDRLQQAAPNQALPDVELPRQVSLSH